jgi:hypothetical protein
MVRALMDCLMNAVNAILNARKAETAEKKDGQILPIPKKKK